MLCVVFSVCGCVRRQISKNARWEASPYFQAEDGKQPLGSTGLKQLEKFVEGSSARLHSASASALCRERQTLTSSL